MDKPIKDILWSCWQLLWSFQMYHMKHSNTWNLPIFQEILHFVKNHAGLKVKTENEVLTVEAAAVGAVWPQYPFRSCSRAFDYMWQLSSHPVEVLNMREQSCCLSVAQHCTRVQSMMKLKRRKSKVLLVLCFFNWTFLLFLWSNIE